MYLRSVAQIGRVTVSKIVGCGFEALLACYKRCFVFVDFKKIKFNQSILWIFVVFFAFFALFGFYYFNNKILVIRFSFLLFFLFISFLLFFKTSFGIICHTYYNEARIEFKKIVWPSRREVVISTFVIFLIIFLSCIFLFFVDFALAKIVFKIINYNGVF